MNTTKRKYSYGSSGVRTQYIEDPSTTLAKNDIMKAKAEQKANSNIGIPITMMAASLLTSFLGSKGGGMGMGEDGGTDNASLSFTGNNASTAMAAMGADGSKLVGEVEGGEVIETPQGQVAKVNGPSHENGGVDVNMDKGTRVYSKRIEKFGETMAERKVKRENRKKNLDELIGKNPNDIAIKNTHARTMSALEKEEQADLETQNLYGMLAAVQEFAFGTGSNGVQKYALGTDGTPPRYAKGYKESDFKPYMDAYNLQNPGVEFDPKAFQKQIGTGVDGIFGDDTAAKAMGMYGIEPDDVPDAVTLDLGKKINPVDESLQLKNDMSITEADIFANRLSSDESPNSASLNKSSSAGTSKKAKRTGGSNALATIGNGAGLIGDVISTFGPMKNTLENRAGDTPNINPYKDFGKDAIEANLTAMEYAARTKDSTIQRINAQGRGVKRSNRNGARGINQMRALDLTTDIASNQANQGAMDSFIKTMMELNNAKSNLENTQDAYVMQGEGTRDMNDRRDRDNFFTQKGKDIATMGEGVQKIGKDINDIAENSMSTKMINQLSKYGIGFDKDGNLIDLRKAS